MLVVDNRKDARAASAGTIFVARLMVKGGEGTDGSFRDSDDIAGLTFASYHNRPSALTNPIPHQAIDINVPIGCGDVAVWPGDVVVGDGVVVIPSALVAETTREAMEMTEYEDSAIAQVQDGAAIRELHPMTAEESRAAFTEWRAKRQPPAGKREAE